MSAKGAQLWFSQSRCDCRELNPLRHANDCATAQGRRTTQTKPGRNSSSSSNTRRQKGHSRAVLGSLNAQTELSATLARTRVRARSARGCKAAASMSAPSSAPISSQRNARVSSSSPLSRTTSRSSQCPLALSGDGRVDRLFPSSAPKACKARATRLVPDRCMPMTAITRADSERRCRFLPGAFCCGSGPRPTSVIFRCRPFAEKA